MRLHKLLMVLFLITLAAAVYYYVSGTGPTSNAPQNNGGVTLASSGYAAYAYLISGPAISQQTQAALDGFSMSKQTLANGTEQINVTLNTNGATTKVMVPPRDSAYFIETTFGDDGPSYEGALGDDGVIVTDQNGYIIQ